MPRRMLTNPDGRKGHAAARTRAGARRSGFAPTRWRVGWRLVAIVAVPAITAACLGGFTIDRYTSGWLAADRVQNLAQMNVSVVRLAQALEDERDLTLGYAVNRAAVPDLTSKVMAAQLASDSAGQAVRAGAAGIQVGDGYQATIVQDLATLLQALTNLQQARKAMSSSPASASVSVQSYAGQAIQAAGTFSASVGNGTSDADLNGNVSALGALLRVENQMSVQRGVLVVALASSPPALSPAALTALLQAQQQQAADQAEFTASASQAELANFGRMTDGGGAMTQEALALTNAVSDLPLTALNNVSNPKLTAPGWYQAMSDTINGTRQVADQLAAGIADRAGSLRSQATSGLLFTSVLTVVLLALAVLISTIVAKSLTRPLRKLRLDALDVANRRLPEMVRRLGESDGASESPEIDPIDVTSADEIGEVARAFDRVHREAVQLAAHQARLRGNLSAMFVNLSRRSQMLVERQLGIIDSLEQSEQDPDRLSNLFRLDHLATRLRRNSENLLVLAGHEDHRKWGQRVALVDVVRAAISEIEQYERIVVNVQQGVLITGRASSDVVHLVAELVENAAVSSSAQVLVTGHTLSTGGVLVQIADEGFGIAEQDLQYANWRLDNPPEIDVEVSRRMGLFVVGRLAARHGIRVRLTQAQPRGVLALVWLPATVAELETAPLPSSPLRSAWFLPRDKPVGAAEGPSPAISLTPLAGEDFRAPRVVSSPPVGATSTAGLPTRMPNAGFAPGSHRRHAGQHAEHQAGLAGDRQLLPGARRRSAEEARSRLAEFQHGFFQGPRSDASPDFGADGT